MKFPYFAAQRRLGDWVVWSNELHIQTYGSTKEEALRQLKKECQEAIIERSIEMGELEL